MTAQPRVIVHADESCLGNGREGENPGGAGGLIEYQGPGSEKLTRLDYWISERATTNNRMALRSAIEALTILSRKGKRLNVRFVSDSQYLVKGMTEWLSSWKARGWRRREGAIENLALWQEVDRLAQAHVVEWQWVRGHNKHPENEYADHIATRAARDQSSSEGPVPSLYEEWVAGQRAKGRLAALPDRG
ncbi:MAG: ribonuclease H family protein [Gemmatimonadaceae bacterium]